MVLPEGGILGSALAFQLHACSNLSKFPCIHCVLHFRLLRGSYASLCKEQIVVTGLIYSHSPQYLISYCVAPM